MSFNDEQGDRGDGQLSQFEKNNFFQGKLMTARDMETEQDYHAGRLQTLSRFVTGKGIVQGIEVSAIEESETELEVTLEPGLVIDGHGRPIVIEHRTTKTLPLPSSDDIYLFIRYTEAELESVPVPDVSGASSEEYMSNRRVESFELTYQESPPEFEQIPDVDTDISDNPDEDTAYRALANRYHQQFRTPVEGVEDPSVFIGSFERTREGTWIPGSDTVRRQLVYDNDMLYAALVNHITDTDSPHGMAGRASGGGSDDLGAAADRLDEMQTQLDTLTRYVMRKSLKDKIRFFEDVSERFEEADTGASKTAQELVERAKEGMAESVFDDAEAFREQVGEMLELDITLGEELEDSATEESLERYVKAVNELQETLADDRGVLQVAEAQDGVCEAADSLEMLYDIVPES
ncbi:MAG: hypothetical protein V5A44_03405 [Haloarculaceae archaeon]